MGGRVVDAEHRDAGVLEGFELGLHCGVAQDGDDRVHLAGQEHVVVVGVDLVVSAAVGGHCGAAQSLDLGDRSLERLAVPEVLGTNHRNTNRQPLQRQLAHCCGLVVRWRLGLVGAVIAVVRRLWRTFIDGLFGLVTVAGAGLVVVVAARRDNQAKREEQPNQKFPGTHSSLPSTNIRSSECTFVQQTKRVFTEMSSLVPPACGAICLLPGHSPGSALRYDMTSAL